MSYSKFEYTWVAVEVGLDKSVEPGVLGRGNSASVVSSSEFRNKFVEGIDVEIAS